MFDPTVRKFLFRCEDCGLIVLVDFDDELDLQDVQEDKIILECHCNGKYKVLRD
jgi:hypothetical protein